MIFRRFWGKDIGDEADPGKVVSGNQAAEDSGGEFRIDLLSGLNNNSLNYLAQDFKMNSVPLRERDDDDRTEDKFLKNVDLDYPSEPETADETRKIDEPPTADVSKIERLQELLHTKQGEIEKLKSQQIDVEEKETLYYASFHSLPLPLLVINPEDMQISDANASASSALGVWRTQIIGKNLKAMIPAAMRTDLETFLVSLISDNESVLDVELNLPGKGHVEFSVTGSPIMFRSQIIGYLLQLNKKS